MILVTGASGHIGGRVAQLLTERGLAVRGLVRDPGKAAGMAEWPVVIGDYADRAALDAAMRGVDTVVLTSAGAAPMKRAALHGNPFDMTAQFDLFGQQRVTRTAIGGALAGKPRRQVGELPGGYQGLRGCLYIGH